MKKVTWVYLTLAIKWYPRLNFITYSFQWTHDNSPEFWIVEYFIPVLPSIQLSQFELMSSTTWSTAITVTNSSSLSSRFIGTGRNLISLPGNILSVYTGFPVNQSLIGDLSFLEDLVFFILLIIYMSTFKNLCHQKKTKLPF